MPRLNIARHRGKPSHRRWVRGARAARRVCEVRDARDRALRIATIDLRVRLDRPGPESYPASCELRTVIREVISRFSGSAPRHLQSARAIYLVMKFECLRSRECDASALDPRFARTGSQYGPLARSVADESPIRSMNTTVPSAATSAFDRRTARRARSAPVRVSTRYSEKSIRPFSDIANGTRDGLCYPLF